MPKFTVISPDGKPDDVPVELLGVSKKEAQHLVDIVWPGCRLVEYVQPKWYIRLGRYIRITFLGRLTEKKLGIFI